MRLVKNERKMKGCKWLANSNVVSRGSQRFTALLVVSAMLISAISIIIPLKASALTEQEQLQTDVDAVQAAGNTGVLAEVVDHGNSIRARAGTTTKNLARPIPFDGRFRTGSNTKTFVAATVLQLVGEGRLSLDDSVDKWLPGLITGDGYDGAKITVRDLLQHTSGIFDYTNDPAIWDSLSTKRGFMLNRLHHYEPRELIATALSHPPVFEPGARYEYSNTNYIVVGEIIKAVTGNAWDQEVERRIIQPLHLTGTTIPRDNPLILAPHAHGYNIYTSDPASREYTDTTLHNMTWAGAAGSIITTTKDQNRFLKALLSGHVLPPAQLAQMKDTVAVAEGLGYGLGILHQIFTCENGDRAEFWGHVGGVLGYTTYVLATPDGSRSVTLSESTTSFSDEQYLNDDTTAASTLLANVFCRQHGAAPAPSARGQSKSVTPLPKTTQPSGIINNSNGMRL